MGDVHFYLKKPNSKGLRLIYLKFKHKGETLVYSFGQTIDPKNWNGEWERVKKNNNKLLNNNIFRQNVV